MARKLRIFIEDIPVHILLKSINNMEVFKDKDDYDFFIETVSELNVKLGLKIHAYAVLGSGFEFLATPKGIDTLPKFMQSLGRRYVAYFNNKYGRSGTLWDGRYKSSIVQPKEYLFDVMCYIEKKYGTPYCSSFKNLQDKKDPLVSYHELYKALGFTQEQRTENYAKICKGFDPAKIPFIESCLEKQAVTGKPEYIKNLEQKLGIALAAKRKGRPKKQTNEKDKKMYKNLQVLDKEKHAELKINPMEDLNFARGNTFLPVVAAEAALVGAAFPIVFTADENPSLVTLVSLGQDNLAVNADGKWITKYVPSVLRKYPFALAGTKENPEQKVILIDEDSGLFSKSKGKQLFKKSGEQSDTLKHAINFLTNHENQMVVTKNVAKVIADSGILEDREISVGEGDEKKVLVNGFKVVDREKLNGLSDDILADWVRKGIITLIDAHLKSLDNIQTLFNIANQRQS